MKKILWVLMCLLAFKAWAQAEQGELFNLEDESLFGESTNQPFTGKPVILIEKQIIPEEEVNPAEQLPPPDLNQLNIPIKTLFGHDRTAAFVDHTTDFLVLIQILNDKTIRVSEQIQFITTKDGEKFKRLFPNILAGSNGKKVRIQPQILSLKQDSSFVPFVTKAVSNGLEVLLDTPLPRGVHRMTLEYMISDPFQTNRSLAEVILPITGPDWRLITERLTVLVMMPKKTRFYEKEFLYGSNSQKIPEGTKISEDGSGTLSIQNTHPLPAYADVRLHLVLDAKDLPNAPKEDNLNLNIIAIFTFILIGYVFLSILTARFKKWKKPLLESKKISPILWAIEIGENNEYTHISSQVRSIFLKVWAFLRFNIEYIIGVVLLILATKYVALHYGSEISEMIYALFLILSLMAVLVIDYYGSRIQMKHLAETLKKALLTEPQGLNLAKREIQTYYQIASCLGFQDVWQKRLIENNPSYRDLDCFKKEK